MNPSRLFFASVCFALLIPSAVAQEGKVVVGQAGNKELKRAAHRLRIPAEQLKNARAALQVATDLSRRLDPAPVNSFPQLGDAWLQLNRSKAPGIIESLYSQLRASAEKASDVQSYQQATGAAQQLMFSLADLDPDKSVQLIHQWPDPPAALGEEGARTRSQLDAQFQNQIAQRLAYRDPAAALKLLPALTSSSAPDYGIRGQLALQFSRSGQQSDALKLADQVIADFQRRTPDARSTQEYANFLQNLSMMDSDRFQDAFNILPPILAKQTTGGSTTMLMQMGDQTVSLSPADFAVLNVFRGMSGRPELAMKTLDSLPDLKAKLDQLGGLDNFLNPGPGKSISYSSSTSIGSSMIVRSQGPVAPGKDPMGSLYNELRGKIRRDPSAVKAKLEEVASNPDMIETLLSLAQRANWEDPDLSTLALETITAHLSQVEPLQRRAGLLQNLVSAYRMCEGEVDSELLRNGFIVADRLRQEDEKSNPDAASRKSQSPTQADRLEAALVSEYARDNFDAAMSFMKSKPDDSIKVMALLQVVQALRVNY